MWTPARVLLGLALGLAVVADGLAAPSLQLGRPRPAVGGTLAVPVMLRARGGEAVAALNFTVRSRRPRSVTVLELEAGPSLEAAGARLATATPDGTGAKALVVPSFVVPLPAVPPGRIATIHVRAQGESRAAVRRALTLEDVVLAGPDARVLPLARPRGRGR
jgi:hypothetical protein